jgi:hypothetical protein
MATPEEEAYPILKSLDADYVLIIFGGFSGYSGDDINKFYWMERIGGGVFPNEVPKERDFVGRDGQLRVDKDAGPAMLNCLMYKLSYHRFGEVSMGWNYPKGLDRARNQEIANKNVTLSYFEEVFTSEHWIVRIYKIKKGNDGLGLGNKPIDIASLPKPKAQKRVEKAQEKEDWRVGVKAEIKALETGGSDSASSEKASAGSSKKKAAGSKGSKKA